MKLEVGTRFDTNVETGCVVTVPPADIPTIDQQGRYTVFLALDSDGIECQYITAMVVGHPDYRAV